MGDENSDDKLPEDDETAQIHFRVPKAEKSLAYSNAEYGEVSERLRETVRDIAFPGELGERAELRDEIDRIESEIEERETRIETAKEEIQERKELRSELEQSIERRVSFRDVYLEELERVEAEWRESGTRLFPGHSEVKQLANFGRMDEEDVLDVLRERNPDLPPRAFEEGQAATATPRYSVRADIPVEEREPHPEREDV